MDLDNRLWKRFNKALGQYQLIDENDHILVGLSGGKDSLLLLEFLARRQLIHMPRFTVSALHVRMRNIHYETNTSFLQSFCDRLNVPLHIITTHFDEELQSDSTQFPISDIQHRKPKPPCFLCSWQRRKQLFNTAQQLGCQKIALGHHQDDIIHTALMNLTFQGHFTTMTAKLRMRKMPLTIIRPLCLCQESDIRQYAESHHYEKLLKECPYEHETNRTTASRLLQLMEQLNPEARFSLWAALESEGKL